METLFLLLAGHALGDFVLQSDSMAKGKGRPKGNATALGPYQPTWHYWLTAHSFIHGGIVYLITQDLTFGLAETLLHWLIDFMKCESRYNIHVDQALHIGCKLIWAALLI
ncbi:MAG: DUF3307 domain-containing protein [Vampirovibrio sp.]|nr:DUF3307 domain-containing protein [Vampirovibrio sp.]